jgi:hypothetical protein
LRPFDVAQGMLGESNIRVRDVFFIGKIMAKLTVGDRFPDAMINDIDGATVDFPAVFKNAPATVIFFYRGRW